MRNIIYFFIIFGLLSVATYIFEFLNPAFASFLGCIMMGFIVFSMRIYYADNGNERRILFFKGLALGFGFYTLKLFMQDFLPKLIN
ncbi:MAG: hypothetical protein H6Q72_1690 [Firmicutes bacterium]|nr:hypothetical protein [Bacillota bacterium]